MVKSAVLIILTVIAFFFIPQNTLALPIGSCNTDECPEGFRDEGVSCADGTCTRTCVTGECGDTFTTVYTSSVHLPDEDFGSDTVHESISLGKYAAQNTEKCYRFRQTTPSHFIKESKIDGYDSTKNFDSAIALIWEASDTSKWYDNQAFYCNGDEGVLPSGSRGAVWIDSCKDEGSNLESADNFKNTNYLYCAPNQAACSAFNERCDTDCYDHETRLRLLLDADLNDDFECNSFNDFCTGDEGDDPDQPEIDYVEFEEQTVNMYVDEYPLTNIQNDNQQCQYWPECNPADPCCNSDGHFRPSGYTCRSAHNAQCLTANSAGCGGVAYEDRCTGTSSACPDNNFLIDYDKACDDVTCVEQSCSGSTLQSQRTCSAGTCQQQATYACPYNLGCTDAKSCKTAADSQGDCSSEATYDTDLGICYEKSGDEFDLSYDKNGNLLSGLGLEYAYDSFNQLTATKDSATGSVKEEYSYDHYGNRKKKVTHNDDGSITTVYYVNDNFIQIVNSSGTYNETYYYANGKLVGKKDAGQSMLFFHPDHLGSTRLVTDGSANVVADLSYEPFGEMIGNANERFLYTGKELDSSGNYYLGARYLDPAPLYTFTQPDQNIPDIYNPQDLNRYSYARNNPYTYVDPNGENPILVLGIAGALIGAGIDLGTQLWNNGGDFRSVDYGSVAVSAGVGFVGGATLGLGTALLGTSTAATIASSAISGVASGQSAVAGNNILEGAPPTEGLFQPQDMFRDSVIGGISGSVGAVTTRAYVNRVWASGNSDSAYENALSHLRNNNPSKFNLFRFTYEADRTKNFLMPGTELEGYAFSQKFTFAGKTNGLPKIQGVFEKGYNRRTTPAFQIKSESTGEFVVFDVDGKIHSYHSPKP